MCVEPEHYILYFYVPISADCEERGMQLIE